MPANGVSARAALDAATKAHEKDPRKAPLACLDDVEALIKKYRGDAKAVRAGIQASILAAVAVASAVSMIPFTDNFAAHFAGGLLRDLAQPGVSVALNAPTRDYLENIFPTLELNVRLLVTGIENGSLTDEEIIDTAIDAGYKDKEIRKLLKIAKMARFMKETKEDYAMLDRYQDALISYQIASGREEIDAAISERQDLIKEYQRMEREQAAQVSPT